MSSMSINTNIKSNCGGDFSRPWNGNLATKVAATKTEQEALA